MTKAEQEMWAREQAAVEAKLTPVKHTRRAAAIEGGEALSEKSRGASPSTLTATGRKTPRCQPCSKEKTPDLRGFWKPMKGLEPSTFCMARVS
jgi:hypothetical protein